jgi:uncharacterized damage-inducible protein DinB
MKEASTIEQTVIVTPEELLHQWQGHRGLTRRVIEAFPEEQLFSYSVGGMRPFAQLALEIIDMQDAGMEGIVTDHWAVVDGVIKPTTKRGLLERWDAVTEKIDAYWPQVAPGRWQEETLAFGQWKNPVWRTLAYFIDNEIHHRGQGYVYLRTLGIEPPPFWDR